MSRCSRRRGLRVGLPVRLLNETGQVTQTVSVTFVSPSVDDSMQTVLVKAALPSGANFRTDQFIRARVVWQTAPGLTVPVTAVLRINGQYFVFKIENGGRGDGGQAAGGVARPGGQQRVHRGRRPEGRRSAHRRRGAEDWRRRAGAADAVARRWSSAGRKVSAQQSVYPAPDPGVGLLPADHPRGRHLDPDAADRALSRSGAAGGGRLGVLHGRERHGRRDRGHDAARAGDQRRRGHALHDLVEHEHRRRVDQRDVRGRPQRRPGRGGRAESRERRRSAGCRPTSARTASAS